MATYLILNLIVTGLVLVWVLRTRRRPTKPWLIALVCLLLLTLVFDSLIVVASIVDYNPSKILGLRLGYAPLEDFFYPVVAMLVVPHLWHNGKTHAQ